MAIICPETTNLINTPRASLARPSQADICLTLTSAPNPTMDLHCSNIYLSLAQRLNFDVLTTIFIVSWTTCETHPVTLGSVCRLWRAAALAVPQIWSRIPPTRLGNDEIVLVFLERSRPLPVHIGISSRMTPVQREALYTATERIQCFSVQSECSILTRSFPVLEMLNLAILYDASSPIFPLPTKSTSLLEVSRYPKLRELHIFGLVTPLLRAIAPAPSFPPLQVLSIDCNGLPYWVMIVENCSSTLVSLSLIIRHLSIEAVHFDLPHLRYLSIADYLPYYATLIRFDTPKLETLAHVIALSGNPCQAEVPFSILEIADSRYVTHLHVSGINLNITPYPQLRSLTIKDEPRDFIRFREVLTIGIKSCPQLEVIRYSCRKASVETQCMILSAIDASGCSQTILLEQLKYTPVVLGRITRSSDFND